MENNDRPLIAVTLGDITGIGPEILVKIIVEGPPVNCRLLVLGDAGVLRASYEALNVSFDLPIFSDIGEAAASRAPVSVLDTGQGGRELLALGHPHPEAGEMAAVALARGVELAAESRVAGLVFGPLVKESLHIGQKKYHDEGEIMKEALQAPAMKAVALAGEVFRVTIAEHVPLREVADLITRESVLDAIELLQDALVSFGITSPRLAVAALNPHAGEGGMVGREEIEQITPAIEQARAKGLDVSGPVPADTVYLRAFSGQFDGVVSLYHDQANIALKAASFGEIVILFVRSPVIITTPSHGPAYGKAGKGTADPKNLRAAIALAASLAGRKK